MKIATWNINGLRARLDFVLAWLADRSPDVVGLQELKLADDKFPHDAFSAAGYQSVCHGQKSWNGVAILSRKEAEVTARGLPGQEELGARLISANVSGLSFTTVYCPNGKTLEHDDYSRKLAWYESLSAHFSAHHESDSDTILCGDFNICPAPLDSGQGDMADGQIFHTEAERAQLSTLLEWGLHDLFREKYPGEQVFSWWDYRGGAFHRGQGLRIDFLLGTPSVQSRLLDCTVDRDWRKKKEGLTASDHAPVVATLAD